MRITRNIVLGTLAVGIAGAFTLHRIAPRAAQEKTVASRSQWVGEEISYDVKFGSLRMGEAHFTNCPPERYEGKEVSVLRVVTKLAQFTDQEKIYADTDTWLPIRVDRDIKAWLNKERITEEYDQNAFSLRITKYKGSKKEETVIQKDGPIQNSILLPYAIRHIPSLEEGWSFTAIFPTRTLVISLANVEDITVPAGTFTAYHFTSEPRQCEIWISRDARKIPLKITGTGAFGYTLELTRYVSPAAANAD